MRNQILITNQTDTLGVLILNCMKLVPGNIYNNKKTSFPKERKKKTKFLAPPVTTVSLFLELALSSSCWSHPHHLIMQSLPWQNIKQPLERISYVHTSVEKEMTSTCGSSGSMTSTSWMAKQNHPCPLGKDIDTVDNRQLDGSYSRGSLQLPARGVT